MLEWRNPEMKEDSNMRTYVWRSGQFCTWLHPTHCWREVGILPSPEAGHSWWATRWCRCRMTRCAWLTTGSVDCSCTMWTGGAGGPPTAPQIWRVMKQIHPSIESEINNVILMWRCAWCPIENVMLQLRCDAWLKKWCLIDISSDSLSSIPSLNIVCRRKYFCELWRPLGRLLRLWQLHLRLRNSCHVWKQKQTWFLIIIVIIIK